jgi:transcriptional regulator with XRE-family HTH domain
MEMTRRRPDADDPDDIDLHVGNRIKLRRQVLKISQQRLAAAVGVSFQMVQKYESGVNRVSASRLLRMAAFLKSPISYFFEDLPEQFGEFAAKDPLRKTESVDVLRIYYRLSKKQQQVIMALLSNMNGRSKD